MPIPGCTLDTVDQFVGKELGVSDWFTVGQDKIDQFADATGDHQWIHVDVERAALESPARSNRAGDPADHSLQESAAWQQRRGKRQAAEHQRHRHPGLGVPEPSVKPPATRPLRRRQLDLRRDRRLGNRPPRAPTLPLLGRLASRIAGRLDPRPAQRHAHRPIIERSRATRSKLIMAGSRRGCGRCPD